MPVPPRFPISGTKSETWTRWHDQTVRWGQGLCSVEWGCLDGLGLRENAQKEMARPELDRELNGRLVYLIHQLLIVYIKLFHYFCVFW